MENQEIIEVEVVSETEHDVKKETKIRKVKTSDRSRQIAIYTKLYQICMRFGWGLFLVFLFAGFAFSILYSQATNKPLFLSLMIVFWVFCGLSAVTALLGFIFRRIANHYMEIDPNYRDQSL